MANPTTFKQATHLLTLVEDKKLSLEQLQVLYNAGLLSDLFEAAATVDLGKVNRDDWKRILGLNPSVFVKMSGTETTAEIVATLRANGFNYVNDCVTQENFPLAAKDGDDVEIEIIDPGCDFSEKEGLGFLTGAGLMRPTYEHALRFAEQHGRTTTSEKKPFVVFLHEAWQDPDGYRRGLFVDRGPSRRELILSYPDDRVDSGCVLAGVRPRKQSSAA